MSWPSFAMKGDVYDICEAIFLLLAHDAQHF